MYMATMYASTQLLLYVFLVQMCCIMLYYIESFCYQYISEVSW